MTELPKEESTSIETVASLPVLGITRAGNKVIVLASNDVNDHSLFLNGLTQNILILYDLFESLGYTVFLLQQAQYVDSSKPRKSFLAERYRTITTEQIIKEGRSIRLFVEIGMSVDAMTRGYLRSTGCKMTKLYLGNILNIDIETIQNHRSFFFNHHLVGDIDEIWTSPHYAQHLDYAAILNRTDPFKAHVVPYVWDPCFLTHYASKQELEWQPSAVRTDTPIVIMDPNISFQKFAFYSLLLAEAYAVKHPEWHGVIHVINGDRLRLSANAYNRFLPQLTLFQAGRILLHSRKTIHEIMKTYRSAVFVTHQWNNEYNYMLLEAMYCDYPVLHNSEGWSAFGYSYSTAQWSRAIETLHTAVMHHADHLRAYQTHAANLIWKHSIHHPDIRKRWQAIL